MNFSEKYGNDIEEAVALALRDLKVSREDVDVEVLEEPSKGFLGLGSKLAKVRVTIKEKEEQIEESAPEVVETAAPQAEVQQEEEQPKKERKEAPKRSIIAERPADLVEVEEHKALDFLKQTTADMGLDLSFKAQVNEENVYVDIAGKDAGSIIGKRGQTLDAIQYLTSLVVNKDSEKYIRVVLDAENYRQRREKTLQQLADRLAGKVVRTKKSVRLEPMNPYERMVIHAALHTNKRVKTRSEGEEPYRRVIIELK